MWQRATFAGDESARRPLEEPAEEEAAVEEALFEAPAPEDTPLSGVAYLPHSKNMDLHTYRMVGRILVRGGGGRESQ